MTEWEAANTEGYEQGDRCFCDAKMQKRHDGKVFCPDCGYGSKQPERCKQCKDKGVYFQGKKLRVQHFCYCPAGELAVKKAHEAEFLRKD